METVPFGLVLSPDYEPHHLTLISIPRGTGELKLLGKTIMDICIPIRYSLSSPLIMYSIRGGLIFCNSETSLLLLIHCFLKPLLLFED